MLGVDYGYMCLLWLAQNDYLRGSMNFSVGYTKADLE